MTDESKRGAGVRPTAEFLKAHMEVMRAVLEGTCSGMTVQMLESCTRTFYAELLGLDAEVKGVFSNEFQAELRERTAECDMLKVEVKAIGSQLLDVQQDCIEQRKRRAALEDALVRVGALGSGPGYVMGDHTSITLGEVRAALRGKP